jgi:hypothetical protein
LLAGPPINPAFEAARPADTLSMEQIIGPRPFAGVGTIPRTPAI